MKRYYRYKTFNDWCTGLRVGLLLSVGCKLNKGSMVSKALDIGERLVARYVDWHYPGKVTWHLTGFSYESK